MPRRILVILATIAPLAIGALGVVLYVESTRIEKLFGNQANFDVVRYAATVLAYRVGPDDEPRDGRLPRPVKNLTGPVVLNDIQQADLSRMLSTVSNYGWNRGKGCIPSYGMKFEFQQDDRVVTALVCLWCGMIEFQFDGERIGGEDVDEILDKILSISREAFPNDEALKDPMKHQL